jgi:Zn-dependent protease
VKFAPPTTGYIASFSIGGIRTYLHWSFPAAGVVIAFMLGDMSFVTMLSATLAYSLLVLVHEAGHAFFARRAGCTVYGLVLTAGGGFCIADLPRSRRDQLLFFSGGLLAQVLALVAAIAVLALVGSPSTRATGSFTIVFTLVNAVMIVSNLVPFANNDGALIAGVLRRKHGEL